MTQREKFETKTAWQLKRGDRVLVDAGLLIINDVSKGMIKNHLHLSFTNGKWSEVEYDEEFTVRL